MIKKIIKNMALIIAKKLMFLKYWIKKPPKVGPIKLPRLKKIPHKRFPVGNKFFGIKSAI